MLVPAVLDKPTPVHAKAETEWRAKRKSVDVFIIPNVGIGFGFRMCAGTQRLLPPMD